MVLRVDKHIVNFQSCNEMQPKVFSWLFTLTWRLNGECENIGMRLQLCDNHEHLINKSHTQARQCKWLMKMELTLSHKLVLDSFHSHDINLEGGHHPPLYNMT